jgi:hypothetical protein
MWSSCAINTTISVIIITFKKEISNIQDYAIQIKSSTFDCLRVYLSIHITIEYIAYLHFIKSTGG